MNRAGASFLHHAPAPEPASRQVQTVARRLLQPPAMTKAYRRLLPALLALSLGLPMLPAPPAGAMVTDAAHAAGLKNR